jgi:1-acyl-sn-glycerol-3-phosphate acyltransferase
MLFGADVQIEGAENLPPADEPVMYTPNHCSFLDIFALSGYVPRRFKYISKIEILQIPLIGWAMQMAKHIAIARMDPKSQLQTLKDAVETLKAGNSLVAFPEGTRSKDGRLNQFKKGPFTMASRAGVRIVPVTIIGTHIYQPPDAFTPYASPRGVRIVIHPPIDSPAKNGTEAAALKAKAAVESALPHSMKPLPR